MNKKDVNLQRILPDMQSKNYPRFARKASTEELLEYYRGLIDAHPEGFVTNPLSPDRMRQVESAFEGTFKVERLLPGEVKKGRGKLSSKCCDLPCFVNWKEHTVQIRHSLKCSDAHSTGPEWIDMKYARERYVYIPLIYKEWCRMKISGHYRTRPTTPNQSKIDSFPVP
jgi:hypothetical protein